LIDWLDVGEEMSKRPTECLNCCWTQFEHDLHGTCLNLLLVVSQRWRAMHRDTGRSAFELGLRQFGGRYLRSGRARRQQYQEQVASQLTERLKSPGRYFFDFRNGADCRIP